MCTHWQERVSQAVQPPHQGDGQENAGGSRAPSHRTGTELGTMGNATCQEPRAKLTLGRLFLKTPQMWTLVLLPPNDNVLLQSKLRLFFRILTVPTCLAYGKETPRTNSFHMPSADSILLILKGHCIRDQNQSVCVCFVLTTVLHRSSYLMLPMLVHSVMMCVCSRLL